MAISENRTAKCIVCHNYSVRQKLVKNWGEMRRCVSCGLVFSDPPQLPPDVNETYYSKAYSGELTGEMNHFRDRLEMREYRKRVGHRSPTCTHFDLSAHILQERFPRGSYVLDIGCGTGLFLDRLKKEGFKPLGLDVAAPVVTMLQQEGYQVWEGDIDSIPKEWPQPVAITMHQVLHHIPDPVAFIKNVRSRYPDSLLLTSDIAASKIMFPLFLPPRHLMAWTTGSLHVALTESGYDPKVSKLRTMFDDVARSIEFKLFLSLPLFLRRPASERALWLARRLTTLPLGILFRMLGWEAQVYAVAEPKR